MESTRCGANYQIGPRVTWLDIACAGIVVLTTVIAAWRGFVREAIALAGWIAAFWAALALGGAVDQMLAGWVEHPALRAGLALAGVFLVVLFAAGIAAVVVSKLVHMAGLGGLDRVLGTLFGVLKGSVIVLVHALVAGLTPLPQQPLWRESALGVPLARAVLSLRPWLPQVLADRLRYGDLDAPGPTPATGAGAGASTGA